MEASNCRSSILPSLLPVLVAEVDQSSSSSLYEDMSTRIVTATNPQSDGSNFSANGHANGAILNSDNTRSTRRKGKVSHIFSWVRFVLMDAPLLVVLLLYASVNWLDYVHRAYILRQAEAFYWSSERIEQEHTYYNRYCDAKDVSTNTTADLFVPSSDPHFTPQDAAAIQLKHGFTFIENVLSPQAMQELRDHIHYKNHNDKQLFVISAEHRFNILLGTEERSVRNALIEVANHQQFRSSLEAMLGPNPALVELTAITSSAGAQAQYWHEDGMFLYTLEKSLFISFISSTDYFLFTKFAKWLNSE